MHTPEPVGCLDYLLWDLGFRSMMDFYNEADKISTCMIEAN